MLKRERTLSGRWSEEHPGQGIRTLSAERIIEASPEAVSAFLERLENHWLLTGRHVRLRALSADGRGGEISVHAPVFALRRILRTQLSSLQRPSFISGTAEIGRTTQARICWRLGREGPRTRVRFTATVTRAGLLDRFLLIVGGGRWVVRIVQGALARLDQAVALATAAENSSVLPLGVRSGFPSESARNTSKSTRSASRSGSYVNSSDEGASSPAARSAARSWE